ncbi:baseplate multidomain protein megatron [Neptunicoccus sediminis]|uniref:baseplate multidomain protein megatron n=1 Tax=Neptunicoccus sediminis TaxID=1892596 RepID=UPI000845C125|nr:glycoside hydrolase TIM-barrel-like domain-containing protein [Neptunicoccus sediminis]
MATILLSAAGAAIGGTFGGTVLGLTGAAIGKAVGASLGGVIDQKILGSGSQVVETGRLESFRLQGVSEGAAVPRVMGRARIAGHLIWSSRFEEHVNTQTSGGGKGSGGARVTTKSYSYTVNVAFALGEGVVEKIGRIWADGQEVSRDGLSIAFYSGDETQAPDPTIAAIEGLENAPSYRGTAYIVFEDLDLGPFGNRIPQFNFEVFRKAQPEHGTLDDPSRDITGVCLIPGTGEYSLAVTPVEYPGDFGDGAFANVNSPRGETDLVHALEDLAQDVPNIASVSLVVSWFGDDLRCGTCALTPRVEQTEVDGDPMPWVVSGVPRNAAGLVSFDGDRPAYGGTPADGAVLEAIKHIKEAGQDVVFYPFILMDIQEENGLPDPYSDNPDQPVMPWRGRITTAKAADQDGTSDKTPAAAAEVAAFFGNADVADFSVVDGAVVYTGPAEWSYRRFILHYAYLCLAAGGVEAFNIGSEMRGLTRIRDGVDSFPAVLALQQLAQDVRAILGPEVKIGYAADWSEYFGYHPADGSGDVLFHLDPLWAQAEIDYIGIDNYMPLADWRDELGHLDEGEGSIYSVDYLRKNVAGGEGFDWYYADAAGRDAQDRIPITDGAYGEPWVFRYKDLLSWWSKEHYNRLGGVRQSVPTSWQRKSKPIRFTELGCPAVDKGANQPNVFFDPKSSESALPYYSDGSVDTLMQAHYLRATYGYWLDRDNNPVSDVYFGPMVDIVNSHVWAWDARPWPDFPNRLDVWSDGDNHGRGHWITGRFSDQSLGAIVSEVCEISGLQDIDVSELYGSTIGFAMTSVESGRQSLQPLMLAFDFSCAEVDGKLVFKNRSEQIAFTAVPMDLVVAGTDPVVAKTRAPEAETAGRVRVSFWDETRDYQTATSEFILADDDSRATSHVSLPVALRPGSGRNLASRWLVSARVAQDEVKLTLPPSVQGVVAGDVFKLDDGGTDATYRIERIAEQGARQVEAVRVEQSVYKQKDASSTIGTVSALQSARGVMLRFLDLPMLETDQDSTAPYVVAEGSPWPDGVAVYKSASDDGYRLDTMVETPTKMGRTLTELRSGPVGLWDEVNAVRVRISHGALEGRSALDVLNGSNGVAIGTGDAAGWEVFQYRDAALQGDGSYILRGLLRGQLGSDAEMPEVWPQGSELVFLERIPDQLQHRDADRGIEKYYRSGPAGKPVGDPTYKTQTESFDLVALRPLSPVHLRGRRDGADTIHISWIRRTRIDGDSWEGLDVPLGEAREQYRVDVKSGEDLLRREMVASAQWSYSAAMQAEDGATGAIRVEVAQVSEKFGIGVRSSLSFEV